MTDNILDFPASERDLSPTDHGNRTLWELETAADDLYKIARNDAMLLPYIGYMDDNGFTRGAGPVIAKVRRNLDYIEAVMQNAHAARSPAPRHPLRRVCDLARFSLRGKGNV